MNAFAIAATAMLLGFVPIGILALRGRALDGVVALELAGGLTTTILLCLAESFGRSAYFDVPVVCAALTWVSGLIFARFLGRLL